MFKNIEFHSSPEGRILISETGKPIRELTEKDTQIVDYFSERIRTEYPTAYEALTLAYEKHQRNFMFFKFLIVCRFIRCNFSNYDTLSQDVDSDGSFNFEQVPCPMRGECKGYKKICQPTFSTNLSDRETQILLLYGKPMTIDNISDSLCLSPHTVETHLKNIRRKTDTSTQAEMMKYIEKYLK